MMENDTQNSQQAASTALHNAPKLAKIAQAGVQGGPAGAATEAAVQYCKEILVVAIAVLLLPVLVLLMLPGAIFGTLTQPSTAVNDDLEVAANVMQLRNAVSDILQVAYEDTLAEIESERASLTYSDIDDSVGGHVSYNAFQLISMYSAYQGEDDYTKISLADLSAQVQAHRTEYYTYTTSEEVRTEPVQKEVRGQTITVQEDHTYTVFTLSYVGDDYFADTVWQLDDKQKSCADAYAHNLTVYLHEIEEHEGISILGQINDALIDDDSPAPGELPAPIIVPVVPRRASEILFKDFYHVLFYIFRGFAELHSFCQFLKDCHNVSFLSSDWRVATAVSFDDFII